MSTRSQLEKIERLLQRLDAAVVVRDPGNAKSADAYEGLRKQIMQSSKSHRIHVAHLITLSESLERGADIGLIRDRVNDFLLELGITRVSDTQNPDLFEIIEGEGARLEVLEPAIVERVDGVGVFPVKLGKARRVHIPEEESSRIDTPIAVPTSIETAEVEPEKSSSMKFIFSAIALLLAGVLFGWMLRGEDEAKNESPVTTVSVQSSELQPLEATTSSVETTTTAPATTTTSTTSTINGGSQ